MEQVVPKKRGRPRKRPLKEAEQSGPDVKKRAVVAVTTRSTALVGRYVLKEFDGDIYLGRIASYESGLYRTDYEDGDCEDLDSSEIRKILVSEEVLNSELRRRRKALDQAIAEKASKETIVKEGDKGSELIQGAVTRGPNKVSSEDVKEQIDGGNDIDEDDSSSDSSGLEGQVDLDSRGTGPTPPPAPDMPPSSGSIAIPEEYVSHLLSVYGVLRSFSIQLFLCPFGLDDFIGAVNCYVQNSLIDAIHVSLLCTLKRHLELLSSEGLELASKCLRYVDWSLLDSMTWPIYLSRYLALMGYLKNRGWGGLDNEFPDKNYYCLPVGKKLLILQILCDDVLDCSELRMEIDVREEAEVGIDLDSTSNDASDNGSRTVMLQNPKSFALRNRDASRSLVTCRDTRPDPSSNCGTNTLNATSGVPECGGDGNSDECRLCGMDGILLCCDGCPSAYHARCIGLVKAYMPEGTWFCPECTIDKMGLSITHETSLVGAEIFGTDPYQQVFLGTCNHLLVLKASAGERLCFRYYNHKDVVNVLRSLNASPHHATLYVEICKTIIRYWAIPEHMFSLPDIVEDQYKQPVMIDVGNHNRHGTIFPIEEVQRPRSDEQENNSSISGNVSGAEAISCVHPNDSQASHGGLGASSIPGGSDMGKDGLLNMKLLEQIKVEPASSSSSGTQHGDRSVITQLNMYGRASSVVYHQPSKNSTSICNGNPSSMHVPSTGIWKKGQSVTANTSEGTITDITYTSQMFKPQAYINFYLHGYFAATAAANVATLLAEEGQITEPQVSGTSKKVCSASSQYMRAFSAAASRFFWPCSEKKLWEVSRERCGWCPTCKAPISSRRGCMLNAAALAATKTTVKILSSLLPLKNSNGVLSSIAAHMLVMEESFHGLVSGPFLDEKSRKDWRQLVEKATSCTTLGVLLLKLEEHIRPIALSGDWLKPADDYMSKLAVSQEVSGIIEIAQPRRPGRKKKQASIPEATNDDSFDKTFTWWRGGKLSKLFPNNAFLPQGMVRRAACRAGLQKISGLHHSNGFDISKRSRQVIWRAAVERSNSASRLALQVRYLDLYLRWNDLVRPEQISLDGKGPDAEASAFRNAVVCDKKIVDNRMLYGIDFGIQKHLPSRVMKTVLNIEMSDGGGDKYWLAEGHIPLYLIKEYEERVHVPSLSPLMLSSMFVKLQRTRSKASRMDVFSYLVYRRDNVSRITCVSCHQDVLLRKAIKCSSCEGFCHEGCLTGSTSTRNGISCLQCYRAKAFSRIETTESPTSPLFLQTRDCRSSSLIIRFPNVNAPNSSGSSFGTSNKEKKRASVGSGLPSKPRKTLSWGIIWRKKDKDSGSDFRMRNILLRAGADLHRSGPICCLCKKVYNPGLMYIRCPTCMSWYHADAVKLPEAKVFEVAGFKCCRCRRIKSPDCPYEDGACEGASLSQHTLDAKQELFRLESDAENVSNSNDYYDATTPLYMSDEIFTDEEDPLLQASSKVEQITDESNEEESGLLMSSAGPQKLPVRRQLKREGMVGDPIDESTTGLPLQYDMNISVDPVEPSASPALAWDISGNGLDGEILFDYEDFNYEDMEFEPQTYFSFTELLAEGDSDAKDVPAKWEDTTAGGMQEGVFEQEKSVTLDNGMETNATSFVAHCVMCSQSEPFPNLYCETILHGFTLFIWVCQWEAIEDLGETYPGTETDMVLLDVYRDEFMDPRSESSCSIVLAL
ncbi:hypothetical protein MLD38_004065 [Melastoma candidum]|uniref:Uncharacterized protein n=1 Tax=Melastoma candidum TaxID=119954 RepID=A0ACB9S962_9MYRT|nr:hypothetical protein MLD38_004065 [Melastoma candidum]